MNAIPGEGEIRAGKLAPIYFLHGEEEYLLEAQRKLFFDNVVDESLAAFNRDSFHAEDLKGEELFRLAASFPMMAERRLVLVRGLERASASLLDQLLVYVENPSETTCLVLCAGKVDMRKKTFKTLKAKTQSHEYTRLKVDELPQWMIAHLQQAGFTLTRQDSLVLAGQLEGAPLRMVVGELDKLMLLAEGQGRSQINSEDLACALGVDAEASPFHFADALLARNQRGALAILKQLQNRPDSVYIVLPTLHRSFGRQWYIAGMKQRGMGSKEIAEGLGLTAWQVRGAMTHTARWTSSSLAQACDLLLEADFAVKGGSPLSSNVILTKLVLDLCRT